MGITAAIGAAVVGSALSGGGGGGSSSVDSTSQSNNNVNVTVNSSVDTTPIGTALTALSGLTAQEAAANRHAVEQEGAANRSALAAIAGGSNIVSSLAALAIEDLATATRANTAASAAATDTAASSAVSSEHTQLLVAVISLAGVLFTLHVFKWGK